MSEGPGQRIDKWLWHARFAKTRTTAQTLARSGRVRINKVRNDSASHVVRVGDVLTLTLDGGVKVIRIIAMAVRRGPAAEARTLYVEEMSIPASRPPASPLAEAAPLARPGKRDRRRLMALKRSEES